MVVQLLLATQCVKKIDTVCSDGATIDDGSVMEKREGEKKKNNFVEE